MWGSVVVLLWPIIVGMAGAVLRFGHGMVCWIAGFAFSRSLSWLSVTVVGVLSGVSSGSGAAAAHRDDKEEFSSILELAAAVIGVFVGVCASRFRVFQKSSP